MWSISGCSTSTLAPSQSEGLRAVDVAKEAIDAIGDSISPIYLVKCEWMREFDKEDDSLLTIQETVKINAEKYRGCYIRHNGLVDVLKEREN